MTHKTIYESTNQNFRFVSQEPGDYFFDVYDVRTNLRVAILDTQSAEYRFTDKDSSLNIRQLNELVKSALSIQRNYLD